MISWGDAERDCKPLSLRVDQILEQHSDESCCSAAQRPLNRKKIREPGKLERKKVTVNNPSLAAL